MKQQVINYEFQILQNPLIRKSQCRSITASDPFRYSSWKLQETIQIVLGDRSLCDVKWIGNGNNSYIVSYFYCVVQICMHNPDIMMKLKYALYRVCQYCLNLSEQKSFVEFLNIIVQEEGFLGHFFQTNHHAEELLVKIYETSLSIAKIQANSSEFNAFERLKLYSKKIFTFLNVKSHLTCQNVLEMSVNDHNTPPLYIIKQKDCYFVLDYDFPEKRKAQSSPKPPQIDDCVIIDEMDEEDTVVIQNDRYSSKSKTDSQATSKEKTNHRVPKFLNNNQPKPVKDEFPQVDPSEEKNRIRENSNNNKVEKKTKMTLPYKQTFSNKLLTNFQLQKSEDKSFKQQNKSHSKSIKNKSPDCLTKQTSLNQNKDMNKDKRKKPVHPIKPAIVPYSSKVKPKEKQAISKINGNRFNYKSQQTLNREDTSVEHQKKASMNSNNNADKMSFQSPVKGTNKQQNPQVSHFDTHHPEPINYSHQNKIKNAISPRTSGNLLKVNFMHSHHDHHK